MKRLIIPALGNLKIKQVLLVTFMAASISGCFAAKVLNANEAGITLDYTNQSTWKLDEVYGKAEAHCQAYGKNQLLTKIQGQRYTFSCN